MYKRTTNRPFRSRTQRSGGGFRKGGGKGRGRGKGKGFSAVIDPAKFVNKAVTAENTVKYVPDNKFSDFAVEARLKESVIRKGYVDPTPIQDKSIPEILKGRDVVGLANTGTGKTAAFLIPLINKVLLNFKEKVVIVAPTRELAIQIDQEFQGFARELGMRSVCCVGGVHIVPQIKALKGNYNFVIGTPGRLKDLIDRKVIDLSTFNSIVLDEADRMLDMGFVDDMRALMAGMPKDRHSLFFSATVSPEIEKLINEFLNDPVRISVKSQDTSKNVEQDVVRISRGSNKIDVLSELLKKEEFTKVLVFGKTKHGVEKLSKVLARNGFKAESIHGDKTHSNRQRSLKLFKEDQAQVLVATDVAARGLDIDSVSHVINYDIPATYDDYVHRIGRTGRGDRRGIALTFIE